MTNFYLSGNNHRTSPGEICPCGHPLSGHRGGYCQVSVLTCHCLHGQPLFVVTNADSFRLPHTSVGIGHALIQGVLNHTHGLEGISLSSGYLGRDPECYRCRRRTSALMPVLVNTHSIKAVTDVAKGKMTRLWCFDCCDLEGVTFVPYVAFAIEHARRARRGEAI